jgi:hypothetical protein
VRLYLAINAWLWVVGFILHTLCFGINREWPKVIKCSQWDYVWPVFVSAVLGGWGLFLLYGR